MNHDYLQSLLSAQPFEPFAVRLSSGVVHPVRYPAQTILTPSRLVIGDPDGDRVVVCLLLHITSTVTQQQADQIAQLLNTRNQLASAYTKERVFEHADDYLFEVEEGCVVACVNVKKVQWYQWEVSHLSVRESYEGRGLGARLLRRAEEKAREGDARIIQCTIRAGNDASEQVFRRNGYREACRFYNPRTANEVAVWQKVLSQAP